ncbi:MAG TPA: hypothetical protein VGO00_11320 [Kofleriaceae bacterium]|nr:hypothetical protein [Kofleriaceae bacterium]
MSRFLALAVLVVACSKPATNTDTNNPPPDKGMGAKIAVPGGTVGGGETKGSVSDEPRLHLQPSEGTLAIEAPADTTAGADVVAKVTVTPSSGFHVNLEYPTKLTLDSTPGVTIPKAELKAGGRDKSKGDADALDEQKLAFLVHLTADKTGSYTINGSFKFAVCDKDQCLPKREPIKIVVAAK